MHRAADDGADKPAVTEILQQMVGEEADYQRPHCFEYERGDHPDHVASQQVGQGRAYRAGEGSAFRAEDDDPDYQHAVPDVKIAAYRVGDLPEHSEQKAQGSHHGHHGYSSRFIFHNYLSLVQAWYLVYNNTADQPESTTDLTFDKFMIDVYYNVESSDIIRTAERYLDHEHI